MMMWISPWMVVAFVVAVVVGTAGARWMALVSRDAGRALRWGSLGLGIGVGVKLLTPFLRFGAMLELVNFVAPVGIMAFWGGLAFAAWTLVTKGAPTEGR